MDVLERNLLRLFQSKREKSSNNAHDSESISRMSLTPMLRSNAGKKNVVIAAPVLPAAADIPWPVVLCFVRYTSAGITKVVVFGPKSMKKNENEYTSRGPPMRMRPTKEEIVQCLNRAGYVSPAVVNMPRTTMRLSRACPRASCIPLEPRNVCGIRQTFPAHGIVLGSSLLFASAPIRSFNNA